MSDLGSTYMVPHNSVIFDSILTLTALEGEMLASLLLTLSYFVSFPFKFNKPLLGLLSIFFG